jgi:N-acetylglucosamine malate deacetylase 1
MKLDILAIGVHPDDVELSCAGTLLRHIDLGYKIGLLDLTLGELGTRGSAKIRTQEALAAARIMGALVREQLDMADGFFTHSQDNLMKIVHIVRKYKPEIVFANALEDRHPDHGRAAKLIADACFLSGLAKIETLEQGEKQAPWRPKNVYHYIQDRALKADFAVDISDYMERKFECIGAFKSQFFDPLSNEPVTPISSQSFLEAIKGKDSVYGRYIGCNYAEGFNVSRLTGVKNVFDLM